jgi:adenylate kinase family enzyme
LGNGGAGKSTLALQIENILSLPVVHLDQFIWKENWEAVSEIDFSLVHLELISKSEWIIEGLGYDSTISSRLGKSDTIVFLDYSLLRHFYWATKRSLMSFMVRPNGWSGRNSLFIKLPYIYRIIWHIHKNTRPVIVDLLEKQPEETEIFHIRTMRQLKKFRKYIETFSKHGLGTCSSPQP